MENNNKYSLYEVQILEKVIRCMLLTLSYSSFPLSPPSQMPHLWVVEIVEAPWRVNLYLRPRTSDPKAKKKKEEEEKVGLFSIY